MSPGTTCPECGAPLPADPPAGVCPNCPAQAGRGEGRADSAATDGPARPDGDTGPAAPPESRLQDSERRERLIGAALFATVGALLFAAAAWMEDAGVGWRISAGAFGFVFTFALFSGFLLRLSGFLLRLPTVRPRFTGFTLITVGAFCVLIAAWAFFDNAPMRVLVQRILQAVAFVSLGLFWIRKGRKGKRIHHDIGSKNPA